MCGIMQNNTQRLSAEAIQELREIYEEEFNDVLTDYELEEMGLRLLRFFSILTKDVPDEPAKIEVTDHEFKAMQYIHDCICHKNIQPKIRGISQAIGYRSSRSGFRTLSLLLKRELAWRDEKGNIIMVKGHCDVWGCSEGRRKHT